MAEAIDTNVVVRIITADDPDQTARADALLTTTVCLVVPTVLLETGWVLRSQYELSNENAARRLRAFVQIPNVLVEDPQAVHQALDDAEAGMDLADAFHRAFAGGADRMRTFDEPFVRAASGRPGVPVEAL